MRRGFRGDRGILILQITSPIDCLLINGGRQSFFPANLQLPNLEVVSKWSLVRLTRGFLDPPTVYSKTPIL